VSNYIYTVYPKRLT